MGMQTPLHKTNDESDDVKGANRGTDAAERGEAELLGIPFLLKQTVRLLPAMPTAIQSCVTPCRSLPRLKIWLQLDLLARLVPMERMSL